MNFWSRNSTCPLNSSPAGSVGEVDCPSIRDSALDEAHARFDALVALSRDILWEMDLEGRYTYISPACRSLLGFDPEEIVGIFRYDDLFPLEEMSLSKLKFCLMLDEMEEEKGLVLSLRTKDGGQVMVSRKCVGHYALDGTLLGYRGADLDLSERREADQRRDLLSRAMDQAAESVVITDRAGNICYVNQGFVNASGYSSEEVVGENPRVLQSGKQSADFYREMWSTLTAGQTWRGLFVNRGKDGQEYTEEAVISPVRNAENKIHHYVAVKRDVTRELELERQLRQAQKMESVGHLAGGIAHDFNNILTIILGNISYLEYTLPGDSPIRNELSQISAASRRASDLTRQLLSFSRKQVISPKDLDLNEVLAGMKKLLLRLFPANIRFEEELHSEALPVFADPGQIEQVVLNLCLNARDALVGGGRIILRSGRSRPSAANNVFFAEPPLNVGDDMAFVEVGDTGPGVSEEILDKIFDPFFTTKDVGKGSGLGLPTAYGIAQQHRGHLGLFTTPGKGARFVMWLPLRESDSTGDSLATAPVMLTGDRKTILLVEDEPLVRQIAARSLKGLGYQVIEAVGPREALDLGRNYAGTIHLLMTDVMMPEMSGVELAKIFTSLRPGNPVLFSSGYPRDELEAIGLAKAGNQFLPKPYTRDELASAVRKALPQNQAGKTIR